jgi:hypothetical protein
LSKIVRYLLNLHYELSEKNYLSKNQMADAKPVEATNHLVNVGLMALATLPPIQPPVAAVASSVNATDQTTWPVKINKVATTTLLSANTKFFMTTVC